MLALVAVLLPAIFQEVFSERPGGFVPVAIAADSGVDKSTQKRLKRAVAKNDHGQVKKLVKALQKRGGEDNQKLILSVLAAVPSDAENIYWTLIEAACTFKDKAALTALGEYILKKPKAPQVHDLVYALGKSQSRRVIHALSPIALKGPDALRDLAVCKIGKVYTKESVDLLIRILKKEEESYKDAMAQSKLIHVVNHMLIAMTGHRIQPSSINWEGWWAVNREKTKVRPRKKGDRAKKGSTGTVIDDLEDPKEAEEYFGEAGPLSVVVLSAKYKNSRDKGIKLKRDDYNNDHIEDVLDRMKIPHTVVRRQKFDKFDLRRTGVLVINCTQFHKQCVCETCSPGQGRNNRLGPCTGCSKHVEWSARLSAKNIKKIEKFVERGGFLFGQDWVIKEVVEKAFPAYIKAGTVIRAAELGEADVVPARGMSTHPYLRGTYEAVEIRGRKKKKKRRRPSFRFRWKIDDESWAFDILNESKVLTLLKSGRLEDHTEGQGAVALAFRPGGSKKSIGRSNKAGNPGVVLMVLSHFGKQDSQRDEFALQSVLYNFLIDSRRQMRAMGIKDVPRKKGKKGKKKGKKRDDDDDDDGDNIQR
jgi:hypothetical protein